MPNGYGFLADLDEDERALAAARGQGRPLALKLLAQLPDALLGGEAALRTSGAASAKARTEIHKDL